MRIDQITFTRFLAAISIVIFHYGMHIFPFNDASISFIFRQANVGVSYFFILSGFVMIIAYGNKSKIDAAEYLKNRFARIYPVYFLAIILLFLYFSFKSYKPVDFKGLSLNILMIQAWIPGEALSFNRPGWSLSVEFFFYIIFPFLFNHLYSKRKARTLFIPIITFWIISQIITHLAFYSTYYKGFHSNIHYLIFYFPLMHLNEFLIGNLAGLLFIHNLKDKIRNYDWLIGITLLVFILFLKFKNELVLHNGLLAIFFVPLIILVSLNNGKLTTLSNKKIFNYLGEISFSIYILQYPIFKFSESIFGTPSKDNAILSFYAPLVFLIVISGISYSYIETPLRERIKKIHTKR